MKLSPLLLLPLLALSLKAAPVYDYYFTLSDEETFYSFTYCDRDAVGEIVIPSTFRGLPVTSIGLGAFYARSELTSIIIPNSVTLIGDAAFGLCSSLTSVTIPGSVTSVGGWAFEGCSSLTNITLPDSVTSIGSGAFINCSIISITLPDSVTSIPYNAFNNCTSLASVIIGNGVTSIGQQAFDACSSLTSITIPDSVTSIGYRAFSSCSSLTSMTIPDGVTSINSEAFSRCSSLTSITFEGVAPSMGSSVFDSIDPSAVIYHYDPAGFTSPTWLGIQTEIIVNAALIFRANYDETTSSWSYSVSDCDTAASGKMFIPSTFNGLPVTSIGYRAFSSCSSLTSMTIPDGVTSIGDYAFSSCSSLTSMTIPDGVTSIGREAFRDCSSLNSITMPDSVTSIGRRAFRNCDLLIYIEDENSFQYLLSSSKNSAFLINGSSANGDVIIPALVNGATVKVISSGAFYLCRSLTSITIPDGVTSIGDEAFAGCSSLTSVTIPDGVTSIGRGAFISCSSLTSMTIPDGVTSIERETFYNCTSLTNITIPDSVTSIGEWAFAICSSLKNITFGGNAPSMTAAAFEDSQGLIALPQECIIYYYEGATGFTSPTWQGIQTETIYRTSAFTLGIEKQGTGVELWFYAESGQSYCIETSTDLENWTTLEDGIIVEGDTVVRYHDTAVTQRRFYRAKRND